MRNIPRDVITICVRVTFMLLLLAPLAAWALYKPGRLVAPQWLGLVCVPDTVCVEPRSRWKKPSAFWPSWWTG